MIRLNCTECDRRLTVKDELAGKRARCPGCQAVFVIPAAPVLDAEPVEEEERPRRGRRNEEDEGDSPRQGIRREAAGDRRVRSRGDDEPDEEDRPRQRSRRDEDEDDRPRRRSRDDEDEDDDRPRRRKDQGVRCPNCGSRKSTKVYWTFMGGFLAPMIINMVRCTRCGTGYNGKYGDYNTTRLTILYVVCGGIGLILGILSILLESK
jgi:DNA-directed RNA polymerase subunit RPC12/RpoP